MTRILFIGVALGVIALAPAAGAATSASKTSADQSFLTKAAGGGRGEVELGKLAQSRASNPQVKQFGQRMVEDHTKANDQLKAALRREGIAAPTAMDPEARESYDRLSKLSGAEFDRAYVEDMVKDHRKDVALFQDEAQHGKDPAVKHFAEQTLPTLQQHLQMAEQLQKVAQR